jgi:hypothetical protein
MSLQQNKNDAVAGVWGLLHFINNEPPQIKSTTQQRIWRRTTNGKMENMSATLLDMAPELLRNIVLYIDKKDTASLTTCSKRLQEVVSPLLWESISSRRLDNLLKASPTQLSWIRSWSVFMDPATEATVDKILPNVKGLTNIRINTNADPELHSGFCSKLIRFLNGLDYLLTADIRLTVPWRPNGADPSLPLSPVLVPFEKQSAVRHLCVTDEFFSRSLWTPPGPHWYPNLTSLNLQMDYPGHSTRAAMLVKHAPLESLTLWGDVDVALEMLCSGGSSLKTLRIETTRISPSSWRMFQCSDLHVSCTEVPITCAPAYPFPDSGALVPIQGPFGVLPRNRL